MSETNGKDAMVELLGLLRTVGNNLLETTASINRLSGVVQANERRFAGKLDRIEKHLGSVAKDVDNVQRDITGAHKLLPREESQAVQIVDRVDRTKVSTKVWLVILTALFGASGWVRHWLGEWFGRGR